MNINIAICDDNKIFIDNMKTKIIKISKNMKYNTEIFIYTDGNILLNEICEEKESIDVLMLDIDMPHISGLQIANEIRKRKLNITLIFVSAHDEMVFDAIQYQPFRYMRKTRLDEELPQVLEDVFELLKDKDDKYTIIKTDEGNKKIKNSEIMHIEVDKKKLKICMYDGRVMYIGKSFKNFLEELDDNNFIQIYSGCAVNIKYVSEFSKTEITLDINEKLPVSRTRMSDVKKTLLKYWREKV